MAEEVVAPYNANPELSKMKQDISDRQYKLMIKSIVITGAVALIGAALGAMFLPVVLPFLAEAGTFGLIWSALAGGMVGMMGGGAVATMVTMKDQKKLAIDEEMLQSYMQGKNYWGSGYRQEVAEYGYGGPQLPAPRNNLWAERQQRGPSAAEGRA